MPAPTFDDVQRARLARMKVRALARPLFAAAAERPDGEPAELVDVGLGGAAAVHDGRTGVVLLADPGEGDPGRGLGPALAWAAKAGLTGPLHVLVDGDAAGVVRRRADQFENPPTVWQVDGTGLRPAEPAPFPAPVEPSGADLAAVEPLRAAGVDVLVEHGQVRGEILGLEVGRVVDGVLEVGVGKHDRAAAALMETVRSPDDVLGSVVDAVRRWRRPRAAPHLLNRLARDRWLRAELLADPVAVGAAQLEPVEAPFPRPNLVEPMPALATGVDPDGRPLLVACSVGIDLDVVPIAADVRQRFAPEGDLVLVTPARDQYPALRGLAGRLRRPARMVARAVPWSD